MEAQLSIEAGPSGRSGISLQPGEQCLVGSDPRCRLVLRDPQVGAQHVAFNLEEKALWVMDLGHPSGTTLAGQRLPPRQPVEAYPGDALQLGDHLIRITLLGRGVRARTRPPLAGQPLSDPVVPAGEFELLEVLGEGAAGKVYAARWLPQQRRVALKVLRDDYPPGSHDFQRFLRECETVARLGSPYVVAVYDVRRVDARAFAIMELVEGPSARELLAAGPLSLPDALRISHDVSQALSAAAEEGIVHRDVKPANVVINRARGVAQLCDFGIAKDLESTLASLTASGMGLGTMAYMPPEQVGEAKHVEPSADVYSLGATLYHFLAGRPPFSPTNMKALWEIVDQPPPPLDAFRAEVPAEVSALVHATLAKDPDERPPIWSLVEQLAALRARWPG